ncbi:hypothetical protein FGB62_2g520 [Gracilaria domingensis]|nr:hypothetical protein FGB62_2g520 [Gracilaria domingensis]
MKEKGNVCLEEHHQSLLSDTRLLARGAEARRRVNAGPWPSSTYIRMTEGEDFRARQPATGIRILQCQWTAEGITPSASSSSSDLTTDGHTKIWNGVKDRDAEHRSSGIIEPHSESDEVEIFEIGRNRRTPRGRNWDYERDESSPARQLGTGVRKLQCTGTAEGSTSSGASSFDVVEDDYKKAHNGTKDICAQRRS